MHNNNSNRNNNNKTKSNALKLLYFFLFLLVILFIILIYNAYVINQPCNHELKIINKYNRISLNDEKIKRLQNGLHYQTVSYDYNNQNISAIIDYVKYIREEFKRIEGYSFVKFQVINNYSILYTIQGTDVSLKPYLLAAHMDVVPADTVNDKWKFDPFSAQIENDFIYARGTMDDKSSMIGQLEAVDLYLSKNGQPRRTIYLAYGHDEEISGHNGGYMIAKHLMQENVSLEYVIDEGTVVLEKVFSNFEPPVSYISIADKGYLTVKFSVKADGGHSSMPNSQESALFILSDAVSRLIKKKIPSRLGTGPEKFILKELGVNMRFLERVLLTNVWFFKPIIEYIFAQKPQTDSLQRTTTALTMFNGGIKENVIPSYAELVINHRIHSSQSCAEIIDYDLKVMNDPRINYEILDCVEPSPISPTDSLGFTVLQHSAMQIYPDSKIVPGIMIGLTDSRFYANLTQNVYKFLPIQVTNDELKRYHGIDERISFKNYENMINFYYVLIENSDSAHLGHEKNNHSEL